MESMIGDLGSGAPLRALMFLTALTILPGVIISMTAFLRIMLVLGFLRTAIGLQQMPPNQVLMGISLFLTYFVMGNVFNEIYVEAAEPYLAGRITEPQALESAAKPLKVFMLSQTREVDLALMLNLAHVDGVETPDEVPMRVLVPAYIVSELRVAFAIGFLLFIPFLAIDLAVAALLNALGMIMLPPTAIALPFKLLIFVLANGWTLVVGAIVKSFGV